MNRGCIINHIRMINLILYPKIQELQAKTSNRWTFLSDKVVPRLSRLVSKQAYITNPQFSIGKKSAYSPRSHKI